MLMRTQSILRRPSAASEASLIIFFCICSLFVQIIDLFSILKVYNRTELEINKVDREAKDYGSPSHTDSPTNSPQHSPITPPDSSTSPPLSGQLLVFSAAVLWGTSGTAQALAPESATSAMVGTARIMISSLVLILCAAFEGRLRPWRTFIRPIFLLTGFTQALFQVTYFGGIAYTGVAVGTMVAIGSCPIFAGILGAVLDKERLSGRWLCATATALTGLLILMLDDGEKVQVDVRGLALALAAGFCYTFFTWMARRLIKVMPVDSVLALSFVVGSVFLLPVLFLEPLGWIGTSGGFTVVLYLGLISAGLAYMLYGRGLRTVPVSSVGTLTLGEPLTAALLGIFFLGELMSLAAVAGITLIFTAQLVLVLPSYTTLRRSLGPKKP